MTRSFSKIKKYYILYTIDDDIKVLPRSFKTSGEAFEFIMSYIGELDKTNMSICSDKDYIKTVESMSEQEFMTTVKHPSQRKFSKKKVTILSKKNLVY